jgi:ATP-dependent Lhr-like helicase
VHRNVRLEPHISAPPLRSAQVWTREGALVELFRSQMSIVGPETAAALAQPLAVTEADAESALLALESQGVVLRGSFTPGARDLEWCDRRLLARIHRYTLNRLRAEIAPVSPAEYMRFLIAWQHAGPKDRLAGHDGLRAVLAQLDGLELPARAWERHVLPLRLERYEASLLDTLCLTGEIGWARLSTGPTQVVGATPVALFRREHLELWGALRTNGVDAGPPASLRPRRARGGAAPPEPPRTRARQLTSAAQDVLAHLQSRGASFAHELKARCQLSNDACCEALGELVSNGFVSSDGFAGLRAISSTTPARRRGVDTAGRWFALRSANGPHADAAEAPTIRDEAVSAVSGATRDDAVRTLAWTLLSRYGVVFRRVLPRESAGVPWRELVRVYRTLEARGEIRGGRFVSGMSGEQFALPDAVDRLREVRRAGADETLIVVSGADPLNLTGIVTGSDRIRAAASSRIVYRNGVPIAAMEGDMLRTLADAEPAVAAAAATAAAGRRVPVLSGYVGRT